MLDYFAFVVLIVLIAVVIAAWIMLAMMPGQIAKKRGHPQAEAINVMGWWGALTMGVLAPIAWVWAYTNPDATLKGHSKLEHEHEDEQDLSRHSVEDAKPEHDEEDAS
jgi:hypothetical protein